ncbi:MAG: TetR/AcrR family transcriptional regulator [Myxococcota bacterium]
MARPRDADSAKTYERIVAAALEEVRASTPRNAISMRKVAERAELSLGTIQYYFERKEDLLEACLNGFYERLGQVAVRVIQETASGSVPAGRPTTENAVRTFYRFVCEEHALIELRLVTNAMRGELHPQRQPDFLGDIIGEAARAAAKHVQVDELDTRMATQAISSTLVRFALMSESERRFLTGKDTSDEEFEELVIRMACRLVRPGDG